MQAMLIAFAVVVSLVAVFIFGGYGVSIAAKTLRMPSDALFLATAILIVVTGVFAVGAGHRAHNEKMARIHK